jgi:hypothetical protein
LVLVLVGVALAPAAAPAAAYAPYQSWDVPSPPSVTDTCLVQGTSQAVVMWSEPGAGATSRIMAERVSLETGAATGPIAVVTDISALQPGWRVTGEGTTVTVVWESGPSVYVQAVDLQDGGKKYGPVLLCTDGQSPASRAPAATSVAPAGIDADGQGGAYVWCTLSPTSSSGDSLLDHVTAAGALATADVSRMAVSGGTIAALDSDTEGHAFVLLGAPGLGSVAVQRYKPTLATDWSAPRSPYLVGAPSAAPEAAGLVASDDAVLAWREGGKVKAQRFTAAGDRLWLLPPAVAMPAGVVHLASDHWDGAYLVGPSGDGILARHILSTGREAAWGGSPLSGLGYATPRVGGLAGDTAGDLFVACYDAASAGVPRLELLTFTGAWSEVGAGWTPEWYAGAVPDGVGGAYVLGEGGGAALWRIAAAGTQVTARPRTLQVQYPQRLDIAGYLTVDGLPPATPATVKVGTLAGSTFKPAGSATPGATGLYQASVKPSANASWTATAGGAPAAATRVEVMPKVTMTLSHLTAGTRLSEVFGGAVAPAHAGRKVLVQKQAGSAWQTVARGKLDRRSRYRIVWYLPYKTATYKLRTVLPAHADHALGASPTATLRVKIRKG